MNHSHSAARLVDAVLPKGGYLVGLVEVYFDESGSHDGSPVLCVAGYIIESENAKILTDEWNEVLAAKALTHFHMIDCAHGVGEFSVLSKAERIEVAKNLIEIIKARVVRGLGAMVVSDQYNALMPHHQNMGSAYNYCIWHCREGVRLWADEVQFNGDVAYFFESGHKSQSEANRIMHLSFKRKGAGCPFRYLSHTFVDKKKFPGVQAADLLAWQMFTDWKHGAVGTPRRKDFAYLIEGHNHRVVLIDADRILYHVNQMIEQKAWDDVYVGQFF